VLACCSAWVMTVSAPGIADTTGIGAAATPRACPTITIAIKAIPAVWRSPASIRSSMESYGSAGGLLPESRTNGGLLSPEGNRNRSVFVGVRRRQQPRATIA
jgi:hypothetical protein